MKTIHATYTSENMCKCNATPKKFNIKISSGDGIFMLLRILLHFLPRGNHISCECLQAMPRRLSEYIIDNIR